MKKYKILMLYLTAEHTVIPSGAPATLILQTKDGLGNWDNCYFTNDVNDGPFDAVVQINELREDVTIECNPNNTISVYMETYTGIFGRFNWIPYAHPQSQHTINHYAVTLVSPFISRRFQSQYVIGYCASNTIGKKYIHRHGLLNWLIGKSYPELMHMDMPDKTVSDRAVWVTSNKTFTFGHVHRMYLYAYIKKYCPHILDVYGNGIKPINNKWDVYAPAKYVLAIENCHIPHAWTEKLSDAFLSYSLPIYCGADNLHEYFPEEAYIYIDIRNPKQAIKTIQDAIANNEWEKRLPAIIEARNRVLHNENFVGWMHNFINKNYVAGDYQTITFKECKKPLWLKICGRLGMAVQKVYIMLFKIKVKML